MKNEIDKKIKVKYSVDIADIVNAIIEMSKIKGQIKFYQLMAVSMALMETLTVGLQGTFKCQKNFDEEIKKGIDAINILAHDALIDIFSIAYHGGGIDDIKNLTIFPHLEIIEESNDETI